MITTTILAIVESFLATLAYAILFNVPKQYYTACGITGLAGWIVYLAMCQVTTVALASFVGTLAVVLISRILTVRKKCPITIFLVSGIIPLVPGAGIYYTAYYLVTGQMSRGCCRKVLGGSRKLLFRYCTRNYFCCINSKRCIPDSLLESKEKAEKVEEPWEYVIK